MEDFKGMEAEFDAIMRSDAIERTLARARRNIPNFDSQTVKRNTKEEPHMKVQKKTWIILGVVAAVILLIICLFAGTNNRAISLEEQLNTATAEINVAEKRRADLVYNLADAVLSYQDYERSTYELIAAARASAQSGHVDDAEMVLSAVAEQYPELKANENYQQLMTELAITENSIAQYRNNYNEQARSYHNFVRKFPNNILLNIMGYTAVDSDYTAYNAPQDAPQNLFDR